MKDYHEQLEESTVYIQGNISIYFDGNDTFKVFDCNLEVDSFWHSDVISMQHARDIAERYINRIMKGY